MPTRRLTLAEVPRPALLLGFAGLIPFVAGAVVVWATSDPLYIIYAYNIQLYYGACILSFMGAVHWGLAMAGTGTGTPGDSMAGMTIDRLGWSVVPALVAWASLIMDPMVGNVAQMVAFAGVFFGDLRAIRAGYAPLWYLALRRPLTAIVVLCLGVALMRVVWG